MRMMAIESSGEEQETVAVKENKKLCARLIARALWERCALVCF